MARGISSVIKPIDIAGILSRRFVAHAVAHFAGAKNFIAGLITTLLFFVRASSHLVNKKRSHADPFGRTFLARATIKPAALRFLAILIHLMHYWVSRNERITIFAEFRQRGSI